MTHLFIEAEKLKQFMKNGFEKLGVPTEEAEICAEILITADKRGIDSHGIGRFKTIYYDRIKNGILKPVTYIDIIKESETTAVMDGNDGMGHVIAKRAMELAIEKAKKMGMGMVAVRNSSHYGIAGYYSMMATDEGMIGITGTNARPSIAPTYGIENMLGTNPLTIGIPTDDPFPFILDCATSISQRGKIEKANREGKAIPAGWVIDHEGKTRTDTQQILKDLVSGKAALTPLGGIGEELGGHKGYGYATVVEILSAALQEGNFMKELSDRDEKGELKPYHLGHFFMAINVENFVSINIFKGIAGSILRQLRSSEKMPGMDRIYTAGEKEYLAWEERKVTGIPVGEELQKQIKTVIRELKMEDQIFKASVK